MGIFGGNQEDEEAVEEAFGFDEVPEGEATGFAEVPPPAAAEAPPPAPAEEMPPPPPPAAAPPPPAAQPAPMPAPAPAPAPAPMPAPMPAGDVTLEGTAPMVRSQSGLERLDSVEQSLTDIVRRVDLLDKSTEDIRSDIARVRDSIASMEGDMRELTSLYDLISTQINPFIEAEMDRTSITAVDETGEPLVPGDLDPIFEPTPEIPAEDEFDIFGEEPEGEEPMFAEVEPMEGEPMMAEVEAVPARIARLTKVGDAPTCHIALLRWIELMLDKVPRKEVSNLLSFYVKIGWISTGIKSEVIDIIRGMAGEEADEAPKRAKGKKKAKGGKGKDKDGDVVMTYDKEDLHELARTSGRPRGEAKYDTWKMSPEDHLKSLILIERIRGADLDKDALEELERDVMNLKEGLEDFFAL